MEFVFQYAPFGRFRRSTTSGSFALLKSCTSDWLQAQEIVPAPSAPTGSSHAGQRRQRTDSDVNSDDGTSEVLDEEEAAIYQRLRVSDCPRVVYRPS